MSAVDPLQLLRDDLKDDDFETHMRAINRLELIGLALGPARCRGELLPFLTEFSEIENDEVHSGIAKQLGSFVELVGGANTAHVALLLPLLEKFAAEEETVIRTSAIQSLAQVIPALMEEHKVSDLFPALRRLVDGEWFTSRCSSCPLISAAYSHFSSEQQAQLRAWYVSLCHDETPMVRKAAFKSLGEFAAQVETKVILSDFVPIIRELSQDDMDSMRLFNADTCAALVKVLSADDIKTHIVPVLETVLDDASWRVRSQLAIKMPLIVKNISDVSISERSILPMFAKLLIDREAEVRLASTARLSAVCSVFTGNQALVEHVGPSLETLTNDAEQSVRLSLSQHLVACCNAFPREAAAKLLVPLMQSLSQDESYVVRRNVVSDLHNLSDVGPNGILSQLVPQLLELAKDPKWRVRLAVIEKTSMLAQSLGQRMFERKLQNLIIVSLSDHVSSVREKACEQAAKVVAVFGRHWAAERFFPGAFAIYDTQTNYLHRMTCLLLIQRVAEETTEVKTGDDSLEVAFFPYLVQAFVDDVANVRLIASQTLIKLLPHLKRETIVERALPALNALKSDNDGDVNYFASVCLESALKVTA